MYLKERLNQGDDAGVNIDRFFGTSIGDEPPDFPPVDEEPYRGGGEYPEKPGRGMLFWSAVIVLAVIGGEHVVVGTVAAASRPRADTVAYIAAPGAQLDFDFLCTTHIPVAIAKENTGKDVCGRGFTP